MEGRCPPHLNCCTAHGVRCATFQTRPRSDHAFAHSACPELAGQSPVDHERAMAESVRRDRLEYDSASDTSDSESEEESDAPEDASDEE